MHTPVRISPHTKLVQANKESKGKFPTCADAKPMCNDPNIGGFVKPICPKTCGECKSEETCEDNDEKLNKESKGAPLADLK